MCLLLTRFPISDGVRHPFGEIERSAISNFTAALDPLKPSVTLSFIGSSKDIEANRDGLIDVDDQYRSDEYRERAYIASEAKDHSLVRAHTALIFVQPFEERVCLFINDRGTSD